MTVEEAIEVSLNPKPYVLDIFQSHMLMGHVTVQRHVQVDWQGIFKLNPMLASDSA